MKQSFEEIVEQHGGTVLRVCRVIAGVRDAEDTWSQTFLAALRAYPDLPDDASAEAWLVSIAHRTAAAQAGGSADVRSALGVVIWTWDCGVITPGSR